MNQVHSCTTIHAFLTLTAIILLIQFSYVTSCTVHLNHQSMKEMGESIDLYEQRVYETLSYFSQKNMKRYNPEIKVRAADWSREEDAFFIELALNATKRANGPCPPNPFGSVLVKRSTRQILMESWNTVAADATAHAEINGIQWAAAKYKEDDCAWWQDVALYTTAEPCTMCMSAIRWSGIGEVIYSTSVPNLLFFGWDAIMILASEVNNKSSSVGPTTLLRGPTQPHITDPYFAWQYNPKVDCPSGCRRTTASPGKPSICIPI